MRKERKSTQIYRKNSFIHADPVNPKPISTSDPTGRLHEKRFKKFPKGKKPYVSQINRRKWLQFAKRYLHWTVDEWKTTVWSDESPLMLRCPRRSCIWHRRNEQLSIRCVQGTLKH